MLKPVRHITQALLEEAVPALACPTDDIYRALLPFFDTAALELLQCVDRSLFSSKDVLQTFTQAVCTRAAFQALPELDLVATPTGFGVVSNQQVSPASRERVQALREELRQRKCRLRDRLIICQLSVANSSSSMSQWVGLAAPLGDAFACAPRLFFFPQLCREAGMSAPGGGAVWEEEYAALLPALHEADEMARRFFSPEAVTSLCTWNNWVWNRSFANSLRRALAPLAAGDRAEARRRCRELLRLVENWREKWAQEVLPNVMEVYAAISQTPTWRAYMAERERRGNRAEDPCFFFGG